jgi:hypothetical protein
MQKAQNHIPKYLEPHSKILRITGFMDLRTSDSECYAPWSEYSRMLGITGFMDLYGPVILNVIHHRQKLLVSELYSKCSSLDLILSQFKPAVRIFQSHIRYFIILSFAFRSLSSTSPPPPVFCMCISYPLHIIPCLSHPFRFKYVASPHQVVRIKK